MGDGVSSKCGQVGRAGPVIILAWCDLDLYAEDMLFLGLFSLKKTMRFRSNGRKSSRNVGLSEDLEKGLT